MTTIAYKHGVIAYDSRITGNDGTIIDDNHEKKLVIDGVSFFFTGTPADLIDAAKAYLAPGLTGGLGDANGFVVHDDELWLCGVTRANFIWRQKLNLKRHYAIGSGSDHAITAMDMGCTAFKALKWVKLRDSGSGGRTRRFHL